MNHNSVTPLLLASAFWLMNVSGLTAQLDWQQQVDSDIRVTLDDTRHQLHGDITIVYHNNSPETLDEVWMHLWPNAYRNGKTALAKQQFRDGDMFMFYAMSRDLGGMDSLAFTSSGQPLEWSYHPEYIDIANIQLPSPLEPGQSVEISTPFRVDLPSGSISRLGHIGQSYQITQWYPKPAVFDKSGWHPMPYLNQGEFYSEYGSFNVRITLPENYTVGATGDFARSDATGGKAWSEDNEQEIQRLDRLNIETRAWIQDQGWIRATNEFPPSSSQMKTLHFTQSRVHDFAWFADKRYKVLRDEVMLPGSGRTVETWAMFTPEEGQLWQKAPEYLHDATYYYSLWNGDYPYNQVTAVDGTISAGGGMEYPNVTVIGQMGSDSGLETVIVHEVGHNWFYGILGSNERDNAWMDEGINSFNETRYVLTKYGENKGLEFLVDNPNLSQSLDIDGFKYKWIDELSYLFPARLGVDQPIQCHSDNYTSINYGAIVYKKTAAAFFMLQQHLGTERLDKAMQFYFDTWKFRHPTPADLKACLEESTGENLNWFFQDWIQTTKKNDLKLVQASSKRGIKVRNVGELGSPVEVSGVVGDSAIIEVSLPFVSPGETETAPLPEVEVDRWVLDYDRSTMDYDRSNNVRHPRAFGAMEPIQIRMLTRLEDPEHTQLFWVPALGWNHFDGWMFGATVHNAALPWKDVTWRWTPLLSRKQFASGLNLQGMLAIEGQHGNFNWALKSRRFGAMEYMQFPPEVTIPEMEPTPLTRTSLGMAYRFNAEPTSPIDATLSTELIHLDGYTDPWVWLSEPPVIQRMAARAEITINHRMDALPGARQSLSIRETRVQHDGVDLGLIDPPMPLTEFNHVLDVWYHFERTKPHIIRDRKWRVDARVVAVEGWNQFGAAPAGSQASFDPLADALLLYRGADTSSGSWLSRQANMERGGLPLNLVATRGFASLSGEVRLPIGLPIVVQAGGALARNPDWGAGPPMNERLHLVSAACLDLGPVRISVPVWTREAGTDVWGPADRWRFSLNLLEMNPWDLVRQNVK